MRLSHQFQRTSPSPKPRTPRTPLPIRYSPSRGHPSTHLLSHHQPQPQHQPQYKVQHQLQQQPQPQHPTQLASCYPSSLPYPRVSPTSFRRHPHSRSPIIRQIIYLQRSDISPIRKRILQVPQSINPEVMRQLDDHFCQFEHDIRARFGQLENRARGLVHSQVVNTRRVQTEANQQQDKKRTAKWPDAEPETEEKANRNAKDDQAKEDDDTPRKEHKQGSIIRRIDSVSRDLNKSQEQFVENQENPIQ